MPKSMSKLWGYIQHVMGVGWFGLRVYMLKRYSLDIDEAEETLKRYYES